MLASRNTIIHTVDPTIVQDLPIHDLLENITSCLTSKPNLLLEAAPGAGKTTLVPLALLDHANSCSSKNSTILVVEPRRVAARSAAVRMSNLLQERVGTTVGYAIRGESRRSAKTRIMVVTDGVLLNQLQQQDDDDPALLTGIGAIVMDEFHERGVNADLCLALCREVQRVYQSDDNNRVDPLKIVVMSATLLGEDQAQRDKLVHALGGYESTNILQSQGRQYPIQVEYGTTVLAGTSSLRCPPLPVLQRDRKALTQIMCTAIEQGVLRAPDQGDVLAFVPGVAEIRRIVQQLQSSRVCQNQHVDILPLYGALPKEQQDAVLYPSSSTSSRRRRVIVSTPIAEASLTLEGVTCVVDSGLCREPRCDVDTGLPLLVTAITSRASAQQRAGRAGRTRQGLALRIYTEAEYDRLFPEYAPPEIASTDLTSTALILANWGCGSVREMMEDLPFVDPPDEASLRKAIDLLVDIEALEYSKQQDRISMTTLGKELVQLPTHPRLASVLSRASGNPVQLAAAVAVAYLLDEQVGVRATRIDGPDLVPRVRNLYQQGANSFSQKELLKYASRISSLTKEVVEDVLKNNNPPLMDVLKCIGEVILPGFIDLVAERKGDASYGGSSYKLSLGRSARLDDSSDGPDFLVVVETSTGDDSITRIRSYASVRKELLLEHAVERTRVFTVPSRGYEVRAKRSVEIGSLELSSTPLPAPPAEEVALVLQETIASLGGVYTALVQSLPPAKRRAIDKICSRVRLARRLGGDPEDWPNVFSALDAQSQGVISKKDEIVLEESIDPWLAGAGSLKKLEFGSILSASLTPDQQRQLDMDYPTAISAPDGSKVPVDYSMDPPTANAKLQQFFGTVESPAVGPTSNRLPLSLSLLSPSGKMLAQTIDLPFFWKETYPQVRAEMRGRYPKHPWPEDPMAAIATKQTKKQLDQAGQGAPSIAKKTPKKRKRRK